MHGPQCSNLGFCPGWTSIWIQNPFISLFNRNSCVCTRSLSGLAAAFHRSLSLSSRELERSSGALCHRRSGIASPFVMTVINYVPIEGQLIPLSLLWTIALFASYLFHVENCRSQIFNTDRNFVFMSYLNSLWFQSDTPSVSWKIYRCLRMAPYRPWESKHDLWFPYCDDSIVINLSLLQSCSFCCLPVHFAVSLSILLYPCSFSCIALRSVVSLFILFFYRAPPRREVEFARKRLIFRKWSSQASYFTVNITDAYSTRYFDMSLRYTVLKQSLDKFSTVFDASYYWSSEPKNLLWPTSSLYHTISFAKSGTPGIDATSFDQSAKFVSIAGGVE